jgi:NAD(P)-dependent dehydrogenase (short-subunit alcohol dehydrogenase family)
MTAGKFDRTSTADEVLAGVDLRGRTILVTGASGGLGEETARALAAAGARVVGTARDTHKAKAALGRIEAASPDADVTSEILDLASLRSVRDFLDRFTSRGDPFARHHRQRRHHGCAAGNDRRGI